MRNCQEMLQKDRGRAYVEMSIFLLEASATGILVVYRVIKVMFPQTHPRDHGNAHAETSTFQVEPSVTRMPASYHVRLMLAPQLQELSQDRGRAVAEMSTSPPELFVIGILASCRVSKAITQLQELSQDHGLAVVEMSTFPLEPCATGKLASCRVSKSQCLCGLPASVAIPRCR